MEQVKTKVWKVKIRVPVKGTENRKTEEGQTIEWFFKLVLN